MPAAPPRIARESVAAMVAFIVAPILAVAVPLALISYVKVNQIGPRVFWAADGCSDPAVTCSNVPAVLYLAALLGAACVGVYIWVVQRHVLPNVEADADRGDQT